MVALFFFDPLFQLVLDPYLEAQEALPEGQTQATTAGAAGGFLLYLKLCGLAALIGSSPFWLYQIWAFILPGLHASEKRWTADLRGRRRSAVHRRHRCWATSRCPRVWRS